MNIPDPWILALTALAILAAGIVRGYSGFGFSMIAVTSLTLFFPAVDVVPTILILEVAASFWLLPKVWKEIDWTSLWGLLAGIVIGTPLGVYILANLADRPMRAGIALAVLILVVLLWQGYTLKRRLGRGATGLVGLLAGILNGGAAIAGPPVILFYFSSPMAASVGRASIIALFVATDMLALSFCLFQNLVKFNTMILTGVLVLPMLLGVTIGGRSFIRSDEKTFRRRVLIILAGLSIASFGRAVLVSG